MESSQHRFLMRRRANAKRRRDILKRLNNQEVFYRRTDDVYMPVLLKGRSTRDKQNVVIWSAQFPPKGVRHVCPSRIVTREEIPQGFVEFTLPGRYNRSFVRSTKTENNPVEIEKPVQEKKHMASVLQDWVQELPFMQQSVLLSAIRGPDGQPKYNPTKMLIRWYRRCVLISALDNRVLETPYDTNGGSFTGPSFDYTTCAHAIATNAVDRWDENMNAVVGEFMRYIDALPAHYTNHFREAIQILGYKHPNEKIRHFWHDVYIRMANDLHLLIEPEEYMDKRLGDHRGNWLASADPALKD